MANAPGQGRKAQPAAIAGLKGNPSRRAIETQETAFPDGEPAMPETLGPAGIEAWRFVVEQCSAVSGMLKKIDTYSLGVFCHAIQDITEIREYLMVEGKRVGELDKSERIALREAEATAIRIGARYGWTPSDRVGKVFGGASGPKDPLQELLKRRGSNN
jgi:phage terminase small subunit